MVLRFPTRLPKPQSLLAGATPFREDALPAVAASRLRGQRLLDEGSWTTTIVPLPRDVCHQDERLRFACSRSPGVSIGPPKFSSLAEFTRLSGDYSCWRIVQLVAKLLDAHRRVGSCRDKEVALGDLSIDTREAAD